MIINGCSSGENSINYNTENLKSFHDIRKTMIIKNIRALYKFRFFDLIIRLIMNTDARSAELAPSPVLHGGSTRGNGHKSALRGTSGNAQCPASRSQVMKPKPEELPACLAACGWRGFTPAL